MEKTASVRGKDTSIATAAQGKLDALGITRPAPEQLRPAGARPDRLPLNRRTPPPAQYGTFRPGTSAAEREGVKTRMTGQPRLSANPKSGAAPTPAGSDLDAFVMAEAQLIKDSKDWEADYAVAKRQLNPKIHYIKAQLKKALRAGDWEKADEWRSKKDCLKRELDRYVRQRGRLEDRWEELEDWRIRRANRGFSPQRGFLAGKDVVAGESSGTRSTRGRADAEKLRQEKGHM